MNRRTGKIARLPFGARTEVNKRLRDGQTYDAIAQWLAAEGFGEFNAENLSNWKDGGHQDWLREQERLDEMQLRRDSALELVRRNEGSEIHEASLHLAAAQLYEVLDEFDPRVLKDLLAEKPENYSAVVNSLGKLSKHALDYRKYKTAVEAALVEVQKLRDPAAPLSDDERNKIIETVDTILGLK